MCVSVATKLKYFLFYPDTFYLSIIMCPYRDTSSLLDMSIRQYYHRLIHTPERLRVKFIRRRRIYL